ncbi:MAG TPA: hypothetical protein EYP85_03930 [Armatimonadetes bacterium]|nr:hypothetical protein [Armatimonadota bacterium]
MFPLFIVHLTCAAQPVKSVKLEDSFEGTAISPVLWQVHVGQGESFVRLEPREGGQCLHLFGDQANTHIATRQAVPNIAYTLEYDFLQPTTETGGYQAVVHHPRPGGHSYWWLEYGPERFFLYTLAGGQWYNRWRAYGLPTGRWYHLRLHNTPTSVRIRIYDETGQRLLAESPPVPHDEGEPAPLVFAAVGTERGVWGMKIDNVRLHVTPITERDDYQHHRASLKAARAALEAREARQLWPQAAEAEQAVERAFAAIGRVPPQDWSAYVAASRAFDAELQRLAEQYHARVLARLPKRRGDWVLVDLRPFFNADSTLLGIMPPGSGPVVEVSGVPFLLMSFGANCLWQDLPSRSQQAIELGAEAKRGALLLAPRYEAELYRHDDSLVDVLQVELRYADGFRERVVPVPAGWRPPLAAGIGRPPMANGEARAYFVEPGHAAPLKEVVLCDGAIQAGWALLALSYQPGRPSEVPVLRAPKRFVPPVERAPAGATYESGRLIIANPVFRLVLDGQRGLVREWSSPYCGNLIRPDAPSPLFAVQWGEQLIYSDAFTVVGRGVQRRADGVEVEYRLWAPAAKGPLEVSLLFLAGSTGAMTWRARLRNLGPVPVRVRFLFPLLDGLELGERPGWYFPQRGGAASNLPLEGLSSYGGMAWLQLLDVYRHRGGGLYLRSDDETGLYKVFALRSAPDAQAQPRRVANIPQPAHPVDPWRARKGVHLSIQYLPREVPPGGEWSPPPATLAVHPGDWRVALADYREWLKTWWKPLRPCPERYRYGFYALVGGAPQEEQRGEEFGSYDWWHLSTFWSIDDPDELARELDALRREAERAERWGQALGVYIEGMVLEKKRRIAQEHGAEWAMMDDQGHYYTYYSTEANPVWNLCPAVPAWQKWDAEAYAEIARRVPLCAMYVDSLGSRWAEVCYHPAHHHETPGIWPRGCAELFEAIRQGVRRVNPDIAIHSEEPGCDYMALHEDGSWSHTLWTSLSGDAEYNPAGLNYFRFSPP